MHVFQMVSESFYRYTIFKSHLTFICVLDYIKSCACLEVCRQVVMTLDVSFDVVPWFVRLTVKPKCVGLLFLT